MYAGTLDGISGTYIYIYIIIYIYMLQICLQVSRCHANLKIDDSMRGYFVSKNMFETIQRVFLFQAERHCSCSLYCTTAKTTAP